jgi:hypothetical protein
MSTQELETLRAEKARIEMEIAEVEMALQDQPRTCHFPALDIVLEHGEHYAGLVLDAATGAPSHHLILLPGQAEDVTWQQAKDWAIEQRGELPTRQEQALLYANLKREFKPNWYWSAEQSSASYAWLQHFYDGNQYDNTKSYEGRARAVRRFAA